MQCFPYEQPPTHLQWVQDILSWICPESRLTYSFLRGQNLYELYNLSHSVQNLSSRARYLKVIFNVNNTILLICSGQFI